MKNNARKTKASYFDNRVTTKLITPKIFLFVFVLSFIICVIFWSIWYSQIRQNGSVIYMLYSGLTFVAATSLFISLLVCIYRKKVLMPPVRALSVAAKKIAEGDFSVRLPEKTADERKSEFDVLYEDFNAMAAQLDSVEMLKNDFVSTVSHEFKTPLSVILNCATLLKSGNLSNDEKADCVDQIAQVSASLSDLITAVLQLSRIENQKILPVPTEYNLSEQLSECIINYENLLDEKNIDLDTDLDMNISVRADRGLLNIVWNNLISNAVKFTNSGGKISVTLRADGGSAYVTVKDSGIGMSKTDMVHIFEKFYQADTSHATKGNGLGLATVKKILDLTGAEITVDSEPQNGSVFTVALHDIKSDS